MHKIRVAALCAKFEFGIARALLSALTFGEWAPELTPLLWTLHLVNMMGIVLH